MMTEEVIRLLQPHLEFRRDTLSTFFKTRISAPEFQAQVSCVVDFFCDENFRWWISSAGSACCQHEVLDFFGRMRTGEKFDDVGLPV